MDINEIRARIDVVDERLLEAFMERMQLAEAVGAYKLRHGLPIENLQREEAIYRKFEANVGAYERYVHAFLATLMELAKDRQRELYPGLPAELLAELSAELPPELPAELSAELPLPAELPPEPADL